MAIRSLGCRTDLMLLGWNGVVDELDDAIQVRSPANPHFFYGNFLLFRDAPRPGDAPAWIARFQRAFSDDPRIAHVCLRWDRPDGARGAADELVALGFELEETVVMVTDAPRVPPRINRDVALRRIDSEADWAKAIELQIATMTEMWGAGPGVAAFVHGQMARYRRFVSEGRGAWFGAFAGDQLAADLGVFVEDGLARYQAVETAAALRRRGICGTLVHHAGCAALAELGARQLVMVGLPDHTAQVYASVGFEERERLCAALRRPG
jgi:hypothetical protein